MGSAHPLVQQQQMRLPDYPRLFFRKPGFRRPPPLPQVAPASPMR